MPSTAPALADEATSFLLAAGYEPSSVISDYRFTWRTDDGTLVNDHASVVAFADRPYTMRTACVCVADVESDGAVSDLLARISYLSAPVALVATPDAMTAWSVRRDVVPEMIQRVSREGWTSELRGRLADLRPETMLAAKMGTAQLSFVDAGLWEWAERITADTLVKLLERLLTQALDALPRSQQSSLAAQQAVMRVVFQLFACRVLEDKGIITSDLSPSEALAEAHERFSENIDPSVLDSRYVSDALMDKASLDLRQRFAFASLTTEMLGHAYENAMVTPDLRKEQGIYYTPPTITRYILGRLPIEGIDAQDRVLMDPACGSGSFLLAGFERLNSLLPQGWSAGLRHQYLRSRIVGFDIDDFAREVAALSLLLTDLHNRNGWKVRQADVTMLDVKTIGRRPTIIVTNPPFKEKKAGSRREFAAEVLVRMIRLLAADGLMGIVLPQSVLDSGAGREAREAVLDQCELLEVATFPGAVFHSNADTAVLLVRKHGGAGLASSVATIRELRAQDLGRFEQAGIFTQTYSAALSAWKADPDRRFVISPLSELWTRLEAAFEPLEKVGEVRAGLQVKSTDRSSVSATRRPHDVPFVDRLHALRPFALLTDAGRPTQWLRYGTHLHRPRERRIFEAKKVLVNANRNPGSPWRLVAAPAPANLFFSLNFHGVLQRDSAVPLEQVVAVLNSPVANAWIDARTRGRWIPVSTIERLPFPRMDPAALDALVRRVRQLHDVTLQNWGNESGGLLFEDVAEDEKSARLLADIDDMIYDAYRLTARDRREVERVMRSGKRPR